ASQNMMEIFEHISPRGQEIHQYSHLDLVRELPQQLVTPIQNIRKPVMKRKAAGFVGDNFYFDVQGHPILIGERDAGGKWVKRQRFASRK
ncbi:unnamed protein product, partial [Allacma fusca]